MIKLNDVLGYRNLKIFQDDELFSFSLDSVILANYSNIRLRDSKIIDFCTGNAIVPLILSERYDKVFEGIEIQKHMYDLAIRSVEYNNKNDYIHIYNEDVKDFCNKKINQNHYDVVLCNPPYFKNDEKSLKNISYSKSIARHEIFINLDEICSCAKRVLKDNGSFIIVYRTDRLIELLSLLRLNNIEPKRIMFVYNSYKSNSNLVLIHGQKNGKTGLIVEKPLFIYDSDGNYTSEYNSILNEVRR